MTDQTIQPLWREVVGDTEPWKRGRLALVFIGILTAGQQCLSAAALIAAGNVELLLVASVVWVLQWLQFYFIWIGVQWIRYLAGTLTALAGLAEFLTGCSYHSGGLHIVLGLFFVAVGCYLGFAPAIYHFACRQQERRSLLWALITAGGFAVVVVLIFISLVAFNAFKSGLELECRDFARSAFDRVFIEHDADFLARHSSAVAKESQPESFVRRAVTDLGGVENIQPPSVQVRSNLVGLRLQTHGLAVWRASFTNAPRVTIRMQLSGSANNWQIDHINWQYR